MMTIDMIPLLLIMQLPPEVQAARDLRMQYNTAHIVARDADGRRLEFDYARDTILVSRPQGRRLVRDGIVWSHPTKSMIAGQEKDEEGMPVGFAGWGFSPRPESDVLITKTYGHRQVIRPHKVDDCESSTVGNIRYIACLQPNGNTLEWALDTEKDSQPISAILRNRAGEHIRSSHSALEKIDGHWVPTSVSYRNAPEWVALSSTDPRLPVGLGGSGRKTFAQVASTEEKVLTIEEASFDEEDHRRESFGLDDIGQASAIRSDRQWMDRVGGFGQGSQSFHMKSFLIFIICTEFRCIQI